MSGTWTDSGSIDCHCNGGVFNLGHRNPRIAAALRRSLEELDIGNHHLISEHRALLAERLVALCPGDLNRVVFGVGGGEAIDMAIKLARAHTRRPTVISALGGYHGHTGLALADGRRPIPRALQTAVAWFRPSTLWRPGRPGSSHGQRHGGRHPGDHPGHAGHRHSASRTIWPGCAPCAIATAR